MHANLRDRMNFFDIRRYTTPTQEEGKAKKSHDQHPPLLSVRKSSPLHTPTLHTRPSSHRTDVTATAATAVGTTSLPSPPPPCHARIPTTKTITTHIEMLSVRDLTHQTPVLRLRQPSLTTRCQHQTTLLWPLQCTHLIRDLVVATTCLRSVTCLFNKRPLLRPWNPKMSTDNTTPTSKPHLLLGLNH